jgi:hypothetical protein
MEQRFTIVEGSGDSISCFFRFSSDAYTYATYDPQVNPTHSRGIEVLLETADGQVLVDESHSSTALAVFSGRIEMPEMQPLSPGEYRVRIVSWANWEATAQNGRGWSQPSVLFSVGVVPAPGTLALLSGGLVAISRRRRKAPL